MNVNFENTRHGVFPHHPVRNSITDELNNRDALMEYTLNLIETNNCKQIAVQKK